jgi:hypothetical protein
MERGGRKEAEKEGKREEGKKGGRNYLTSCIRCMALDNSTFREL